MGQKYCPNTQNVWRKEIFISPYPNIRFINYKRISLSINNLFSKCGQYFEWFICNHFFTIKLHFHQKNSGNLDAHLIHFPAVFNSFDTLFIVRTVELLEIAINHRLHLLIFGKSLITEPFYQVWTVEIIRGG